MKNVPIAPLILGSVVLLLALALAASAQAQSAVDGFNEKKYAE